MYTYIDVCQDEIDHNLKSTIRIFALALLATAFRFCFEELHIFRVDLWTLITISINLFYVIQMRCSARARAKWERIGDGRSKEREGATEG